MSGEWDLIIVGGGLGGAALAKCMAERGARVLVLEREKQFKDRVRGEFVTPWGVAEAKLLNIDGLIRDKVGLDIPWVNFYSAGVLTAHRDVVATTPHQVPCLAFYHPSMQEVLIEAAVGAGATVRRGASVREVHSGGPAKVLVEESGRTEEIQARLVVGADGRSSLVRASAGFHVQRDPDNLLIAGVLLDNMASPEDTAQLVFNSTLGQIAAVFPQGGGRARNYFCFHTGSQPRIQGPGDFQRFIEGCKRTGVNSAFYDGAKVSGPLATFDGAESWVSHPYQNGVTMIGDAAACSDPSWGQGVGQTLRDVRVLRDHLLATQDWDAAGNAYAAEHDQYSNVTHLANLWYTELYVGLGPEADARRARALPLIDQDLTRQPDTIFSGPDMVLDEKVRKRFFGED